MLLEIWQDYRDDCDKKTKGLGYLCFKYCVIF